jgi:hypothetical protein
MVHVDKTSYAYGAISPALRSRHDLPAYASGAAVIENMIVPVEASLTRRPGSRFIAAQPDEATPCALKPFRAGHLDHAVLIFTPGRMRVARGVGLLSTDLTGLPFAAADLDAIRVAQSVDQLFTAWGGKPQVLSRLDATTWSCVPYENAKGPLRPQNVDVALTLTCGVPAGQVFSLTASSALFQAGHVGSVWRIDEPIDTSVPSWLALEAITAGDLRRYNGHVYRAENTADSGANAPTHTEGSVVSGAGKVKWTYLHDGYVYGTITAVASSTVATFTAVGNIPSTLSGAATYRWWEAAWSDVRGWPDNVRMIDGQRLLWTRRDEFWATQPGDFFTFHQTDDATSSIAGRLVPRDGSRATIAWIIGSNGALLGTDGGTWQVRAATVTDPLDATNVRALEDGTDGSAMHEPAVVDGGVIFIGSSGERIHFAELDRIQEKVAIQEPSVRASHLLAPSPLAQIVYQRDPFRLLWGRTVAGELLSLTWRPAMELLAWCEHPEHSLNAGDAVEQLCVIRSADGRTDELWMSTRRQVNGTTRRYIEKLMPAMKAGKTRARPMPADAWYMDCALPYSGTPTSALTGLSHLEGRTVRILADGGQLADRVVADGAVTLDRPVSSAIVGLPIRAYVENLPAELTTSTGSTKGSKKSSTSLLVEYVDAAGGELSINGAEPSAILTGGGTGAMKLKTGRAKVTCDFVTNDDGTVLVGLICDNALPFTLIGLSPDLNMGG